MEDFKYYSKSKKQGSLVEVPSENRSVEIKIKTSDDSEGVPFKLLSTIFYYVQNSFEELGNYFAGEGYKDVGPSKKPISNLTEISLLAVKKGSIVLQGEMPSYCQHTLSDEPPLSTKVLDSFNKIIENIESKSDISSEIGKIIKKDNYKTKILGSISEFWPNERAKYNLSIKVGNHQYKNLSNNRKVLLRKFLEGERKIGEEELIGPLTSLSIVEPLIFSIGKKPKIKCEFRSSVRQIAKRNIGNIVKIRGRPITRKKGGHKIFEKVNYISPIKEWDFNKIAQGEYIFEFREPITAKVNFIDEMVVLENDNFNILIIADHWEEALEQFEESFVFLWEKIALESDENLTEGAINLKNILNDLVERSR